MKPGRDLDSLVAERVMGWAITYVRASSPKGYPPSEPYDLAQGEGRPVRHEVSVLPYSTDIGETRNVEAHIQTLGPEVYGRFIQACESFGAHRRAHGANTEETWLSADPADVCLAALKAVGWGE